MTADEDRGLAVERTRLAWRRTSLTATGVLVIGVFRLLLPHPSRLTVAGVVLFAVVWLGLMIGTQRRISALTRASGGTAGRLPFVVTVLVAAGAAVSLLVLG